MLKVQLVQDDSSHWYIIPNELVDDFYDDEVNESMIDSGAFDQKWKKYRVNGVNGTQLWVENI